MEATTILFLIISFLMLLVGLLLTNKKTVKYYNTKFAINETVYYLNSNNELIEDTIRQITIKDDGTFYHFYVNNKGYLFHLNENKLISDKKDVCTLITID